jgi:putative inorganic carbon (hco3(-)) transporter
VIPLALYGFLYRFDLLYYLMIFSLPLSVQLDDIGLGVGLSMPGELLLVLVLIGVIWRSIYNFKAYKLILKQPISLIIGIQLLGTIICASTSVLPAVSLKHTVMQIGFLWVFYFFALKNFQQKIKSNYMIISYLCSLSIVILYTLAHHYQLGKFSINTSNRPSYPFFNDHTIYAASLCLLTPLLLAIKQKGKLYLFYKTMLVACLISLALSFSRAGMISSVVAIAVGLALYFKLGKKWVLGGLVILTALGSIAYVTNVKLSHKTHMPSDIKSWVTSTVDVENYSNKERFNRWYSAAIMFTERPITGFGPGTYMFVYGRYQHKKSAISVNDASGGGAHSEYFKPLSEQGIIGISLTLLLMIMVVTKGIKLSYALTGQERLMAVACTVALISYYIHGIFNYFLDTDKSAILFWGIMAYLVSLDIDQKKHKTGLE